MCSKTNVINFLNKKFLGRKIENIILFGAGVNGLLLSKSLINSHFKVNYFCDNDPKKWNRKFNGIPCISPQELKNFNPETTVISIASLFWREILTQINDLGFVNCVNLTNYIDEYEEHFNHKLLKRNIENLKKLREILFDDRSKIILDNIVEYRYSGSDEFLIQSYDPDQYYPSFITNNFSDSESYVDCGAYYGENIDQFLVKCNNRYNEIFAFEPDPENFLVLQNHFGSYPKITLFNAGVYRHDKVLSFETGCKTASKISVKRGGPEKTESIQVRKLDSALKSKSVSFIKMDIEGAEMAALTGSRNLILKNKPKLAICVYHKPSDLWEIPLYIHTLNPEYKIFLRHHSFTLTETVCYAI